MTDEGDLVLDPFAGSNTTGFSAELLGRQWLSAELNEEYLEGSKIRFESIEDKGLFPTKLATFENGTAPKIRFAQ